MDKSNRGSQNIVLSSDQETIIAQCTPTGSGALALLRLSGSHSFAIATAISKLPHNKKIDQLPTHTIEYGWVVDTHGKKIDQVLFFIMAAPHTFTGQDTVEISCHNNPFIIESIIQQAVNAGARLAQPGEFTKRAVLNEKIDLVQAEAINELIHANTQQALKLSLAQLEGTFSHWIKKIERDLIKALAFSEASFEFIDEENLTFDTQISYIIDSTLTTIETIKKTFDQQHHIRSGIRIALIGTVNAGKSSLFNALLNKERSIVTHIAGTTRDSIEAGMYHNGTYWTLIDTAGLRQTNDIVEEIGIKRSWQEAHQADIIILVIDPCANSPEITALYDELTARYAHKIIYAQTKQDIVPMQTTCAAQETLLISSVTRHNICKLEQQIEAKIAALLKNCDAPFLLNKRQFTIMLSLEQKLLTTKTMCMNSIQYELLSYHLTDALATLSELTGKTITEQGMDAVFREFCVGK